MVHGRRLVHRGGSPLLDVFMCSSHMDLIGISACLAMACMYFMLSCRVCSGGGAIAGGQQFETVPPCARFVQSCAWCTPKASELELGADAEESRSSDDGHECLSEVKSARSSTGTERAGKGPAGINAPGPQCQCFMPACVACMEGPAQPANSQPSRKRKHGRKRELPAGHSKCSLRQELEIDSRMHQGSPGIAATVAGRSAALAAAFLLIVQPSLTALEMTGRPLGGRWDFFEIYSGCANFTAAVLMLGLCVGPGVDILHKPGCLRLDCLLESSQALLQAVLAEARPRWLHVGPPCTFWCAISRWTAHATQEGWDAKRKKRELIGVLRCVC